MMTFGRWARSAAGRTTASVVACLFALQVLLTASLSAQMTLAEALGPYVICVSSGETPPSPDQTPSPQHHADCAVCAFAALTPLAPLIAVLQAPPGERGVNPQAPAQPALRLARLSDPRSSRGPPVLL